STMSRSIFSFAGKAATAQKAYVNSAIDAKRQANVNFTVSDPEDEGRFRQGLHANVVLTRQQGALSGLPPEAIENEVAKSASNIYAAQIFELGKTRPFEAQKLLEANQSKLWYDDAKKVEDFVKQ